MTPAEVLTLWRELTGQTFRLVPYEVQAQAVEFVEAGFTREEVALVVAYTRREIARNSSGFNAQSLTWRVLAADRWAKFQERLDLATEAHRRRPLPVKLISQSRQLPDGRRESVQIEAPAPEPQLADRATVAAAVHQLAEQIGRRPALPPATSHQPPVT